MLQLLKAIVLREIKDTGEIHPNTVVLTLIHSRYWWPYWQPTFSGLAPSLDAHSARGFDYLVVVHVNAEPFDSECEQACCFLRIISINVFSLCRVYSRKGVSEVYIQKCLLFHLLNKQQPLLSLFFTYGNSRILKYKSYLAFSSFLNILQLLLNLM